MVLLKFFGFLTIVISYLMTSAPFYIWSLADRYRARKAMTKIAYFYSHLLVLLLGIRTLMTNKPPKKKGNIGRLIVSNHLSYLDAIVMMTKTPACFVTSIEMKKTPLLGQICDAGGCLYVERRDRSNLSNEIKDVTMALKSGLDVVIYPEATSTNGEQIKSFKRPLFQAAIDSGAEIITNTINYRKINQEKVTIQNRDFVYWYGDMAFLPHLLGVMSKFSIEIDLTNAGVIQTSLEDNTTDLSLLSYEYVNNAYTPVRARNSEAEKNWSAGSI